MNLAQNITDPNQLPQPLSDGMLNERERRRRQRFLDDPVGLRQGGTSDAITAMQYLASNVYNTIQGSRQDAVVNQQRQDAIDTLQASRQNARESFNDILLTLSGATTFNGYMRALSRSVEYEALYNDYRDRFVELFVGYSQNGNLHQHRQESVDIVRDFRRANGDFWHEQERQRVINRSQLQGGGRPTFDPVPRAHMLMLDITRNALYGSGGGSSIQRHQGPHVNVVGVLEGERTLRQQRASESWLRMLHSPDGAVLREYLNEFNDINIPEERRARYRSTYMEVRKEWMGQYTNRVGDTGIQIYKTILENRLREIDNL